MAIKTDAKIKFIMATFQATHKESIQAAKNEIEIYYRWCDLDKEHQYSVVCNFRGDQQFSNYWIYWLWYNMGQVFPNKLPFGLYPYKMDWADQKLINKYKFSNNSHMVATAILKHFSKVK